MYRENKMKTEQLIIALSAEEIAEINKAFNGELISADDADSSKNEFIRRLLKVGLSSFGIESEGMKVCVRCKYEKPKSDFSAREGKILPGEGGKCRQCERKLEKIWRDKNIVKVKAGKKKSYNNNKEKILDKNKLYYENNKESLSEYHKEYIKDYYEDESNREKRRELERANSKIRRQNDPVYKLRKYISGKINSQLKKSGNSKNGESYLDYFDYSIDTLKENIELLFYNPDNLDANNKSWMTWENNGVYNPKTWDDNDSSTWVWNLDHITPQSDLPFISMEEDNFKKCWALGNLRPLSAKQNILDGTRRTRHKTKL